MKEKYLSAGFNFLIKYFLTIIERAIKYGYMKFLKYKSFI